MLKRCKPDWRVCMQKLFDVMDHFQIEGKLVRNEINDFHEIAIFKTGVTL